MQPLTPRCPPLTKREIDLGKDYAGKKEVGRNRKISKTTVPSLEGGARGDIFFARTCERERGTLVFL